MRRVLVLVIVLVIALVAARSEARLLIKARGELRPHGPVLVFTVRNLGPATWLSCSYGQFTQYGSEVGRRLVWDGGFSSSGLSLCGRHSALRIDRGETHELVLALKPLPEGSAADHRVTWLGRRVRVLQRSTHQLRVGRVRDL